MSAGRGRSDRGGSSTSRLISFRCLLLLVRNKFWRKILHHLFTRWQQ